ncbi:hypothetical protein HDU96_001048 [Phlyctochytrium bullatum]|nr:hypothetical protein HDU96_001048 [Phlyctochytrium bullatum]
MGDRGQVSSMRALSAMWLAADACSCSMEVQNVAFDVKQISLEDNQVLLKILYISVDPYMRDRMRVNAKFSNGSFVLNEPMNGRCVAKVIKSNNAGFSAGDIVVAIGGLPWKEYHVSDGTGLSKVVPAPGMPLSYFLGVAGMPGFTAYAGLLKIGMPKAGETLYVSGAAGAVGLVACQIGKALGLKVVGSAGSDDKVDFLLKDVGIDAAFNYKTVDYGEALDKHCPAGIDIYFDNVGGEMLDAVLPRMNIQGRIVACGMISEYNETSQTTYGIKNLMNLIVKRILIQGFVTADFYPTQTYPEFLRDITAWIKEGKIRYRETIWEGIENVPKAFVGMLKGENLGKAVVKVASN